MLESIITSCEVTALHSKHITINEQRINDFVSSINGIKMEHWLSSSPFGLLELPIQTIINFLLIYESIDFSFWGTPKWTITAKGKQLDGSIALLYALLTYVTENETTDFSTVSETQFRNILKGNTEIPLLKERYKIVQEISKIVNEKMNGNFYQYVSHMTTDIELFDTIISHFDNFKDERIYHHQRVFFYKLAQLLTSDILHIREIKEHIIPDYSHLVGCSDYKIPQVLRGMGILVYDTELAQQVDHQIELPKNSEYEIEIRANTLHVINIIYHKLNRKYPRIDINDYIYMKKKEKEFTLLPYHFTRCTNY